MKIGKKPGGAPPPTAESAPGEWCVPVSASVLEHVPNDILRPWLALESFARDKAECWPSNKALATRMGVKDRAVQLALEALEDHGIIVRQLMPGNRRILAMVRRTLQPMTAVAWKAMTERAGRMATGRANTAKVKATERKRYKPPTKVVG